jgi:hypothetical protein
MTNYERICQDKEFCASVISSVLHEANYEDNDFDPSVMKWLELESKEATHDQSGI